MTFFSGDALQLTHIISSAPSTLLHRFLCEALTWIECLVRLDLEKACFGDNDIDITNNLALVLAFAAKSKTLVEMNLLTEVFDFDITASMLRDITTWLTRQPVRDVRLFSWSFSHQDDLDYDALVQRFYGALFGHRTLQVLHSVNCDLGHVDNPSLPPTLRDLHLWYVGNVDWLCPLLPTASLTSLTLTDIYTSTESAVALALSVSHSHLKNFKLDSNDSQSDPIGSTVLLLLSALLTTLHLASVVILPADVPTMVAALRINPSSRSLTLYGQLSSLNALRSIYFNVMERPAPPLQTLSMKMCGRPCHLQVFLSSASWSYCTE
ncbi:Aste57867_23807 [Aphanomyces stellatus]|uniref:Aste57867_23807 protein n=1 Tax=Aphanomyces stellatus TaxID=120398 RepID=A0A485LNT5_9STRA|nr:hypothetical protein As57867_023734 [Aphanomyces stellatus]VFU00452.1 Aste57867_23807 [Aphanomyces stellatus]